MLQDCYQLIYDEEKLLKFIEWLPDLKEDEKYMLCLFGRKKYTTTHLKSNKTQLGRWLATKENFVNKIRQREIPLGTYWSGDIEVPQEALSLYVTVNPRDMVKATKEVAKKALDLICNEHHNYNIVAEALSCVQRSKGKTQWIDFDIDDNNFDVKILEGIVNEGSYRVLKTRGGFHVLVDPSKVSEEFKTSFYTKILVYSDQVKDNLLPVPGSHQGGYIPYFII